MKGAIFDMDGLMFDTEAIWQKNWKLIATDMGIVLDPAFSREICGTTGKLMDSIIEKYYGVPNGNPIALDCSERVHRDLELNVPEKKGIHEILIWLKDNDFKVAVASSSRREQIEKNLSKTNTEQYVDVFCSGRECAHGKPAPDVFLLAAKELHLDASECYIFEDAYNGIRAAYAAGGKPIMIPDTQQPDQEMYEKSHAVCCDLLEALELLKRENL